MSDNKELSTTALAQQLNKSSQVLFQQLADLGLITRNGDNWELTITGKSKGGLYREIDKYKRYIVWPKSLKEELENIQLDRGQSLLTSTAIGKYFDISATRINSILSELGFIEKGVKGWLVTNLGKRIGGVQSQDKTSGVPYVRWPESIKTNKVFLSGLNEVKGDILGSSQLPVSNAIPDEVEFREKFKAIFRTSDGHYVRSKSEMAIDNALYGYGLVHAYERKLPIEEVVYSDFYLPTARVYIEFWGYDEDSKYISRKEEKLKIYKKYDFRLIQLTENEVQNLDDNLPRLLLGYGIRTE